MKEEMKSSVHILIVEDNPGDAKLLQRYLSRSSLAFETNFVTDGEEAIQYLQKQPPFENAITPDFVILDLNIPKKSGHEVLEEVKGDITLRTIPILVLTSSSAEVDIKRARALGANAYLLKPMDLQGFEFLVKEIEGFWNSQSIPQSSIY
jgi:two-component system, chemotaxis family, response regulator Rcp1